MKQLVFITATLFMVFACEKEQSNSEKSSIHTVRVTLNPTEGGSVTPNGGSYIGGEEVSFNATPSEEYTFKNWSGSVSSTKNPLKLAINENQNLVANFEESVTKITKHTVTVSLNPSEGGSVSPGSGEFNGGEEVSFSATPSKNYTFKNWSGSVSSTENPLKLAINENKNLVANFEEKTCKIVPKDGLLIIEGESFDLKGKWRILEDEKASGGKYIEYYGANSYQSQNLAHEISVKVYIEQAKTYLVRWYMRQPLDAEGDKSNDIWIYFPDNIGLIKKDNSDFTLTAYEKFVSRDLWHTSGFKEGKGEFTYGGAINYGHNKSSWMRVRFPEPGEYTLKVCARSEQLQLDKFVLSSGVSVTDAGIKSKNLTETLKCE